MIPINVDVNATRNDYMVGSLSVYSHFYTIQGEGPYGGEPAIFIRLAGCNIGLKQDCPWCDTAFELEGGTAYTPFDVSAALRDYRDRGQRSNLIVVTGGEPLLQWDTMRIVIQHVEEVFPGYEWQFETNGLLLRQEMVEWAKEHNVVFVVSPKVPHSHKEYRPLPMFFIQTNPSYADHLCLKYVVEDNPDSPYHNLPVDAFTAGLAGFAVYISGMTVYHRAPLPGEVANVWDATLCDQHATALNYNHAARLALATGFTLSFQTHLFGAVQ